MMDEMNRTPDVSILIATYNAGKTLRKALDSVLALSCNDWECLVIDGKSTDNTLGIIKEYEERDTRIRHISERDEGLYDAFNKGWRHARGEWIYYLGADDMLTKDGMAELMQEAALADRNTAVVSGGVIRIRQDNSRRVMMSKGFIGSHQSMVMRRSVLEEMGGFHYRKYKILADYDLFIRIKNQGYSAKNCKAVVACFCAGGTSEKLSSAWKVLTEKYSILKSDSFCRFPLLLTLRDSMKTISGSLLHRMVRLVKINHK